MSYASKQQIKTIAEKIDSKLDEKVNTTAYNAKVTEYDAKIATLEQTTAEQTEQIADLEAENRQQAFQIADLKNIVYDTVVEDAEYTYESLDVAPIPSYVSDGTNYHKVFDGAETMLAEVQGKTVNAPLAREAVIKGATKKWNQLIEMEFDFKSTGGTSIAWDGKEFVLTGTCTTSANYVPAHVDLKAGHKYFINLYSDSAPSDTNQQVFWQLYCPEPYYNTTTANNAPSAKRIITAASDFPRVQLRLRVQEGLTYNQKCYVTISDLTDDYGAGNEPTTVEQFLTDNPQFNGYVPHTTGAIASAEITDYTVCGDNLWNEQWEVGSYGYTTGEKISNTDRIRCKDQIKVEPNTDYFFLNLVRSVCWYDGNHDFISGVLKNGNMTLKSPASAYYMAFNMNPTYGTTYNHDVAIVKGTTGTYSPYIGQTVSIDTEASGLPAVQDEVYCVVENGYLVTKKTARFAKVDLGTLDYSYGPSGATRYSSRGIDSLVKAVQDNNTKANILCSKLSTGSASAVYSGTAEIAITANAPLLWILGTVVDTTDPAVFKQAMSGIYLYYELATPVTTELSRVPLTIDFEQIKNVLVSNTNAGIADVATEVQTGVLKNSVVSGVQVNGANLALLQNGAISTTTFIDYANTKRFKTDYIKVSSGNVFTVLNLSNNIQLRTCITYDNDKNPIEVNYRWLNSTVPNLPRMYGTIPENVHYVRFVFSSYPQEDDITDLENYKLMFVMGNVQSSTYKPHHDPWAFSLPSPQELRSAGTAHDAIRFVEQGDGTWNVDRVEPIGDDDLGTLTYTKQVYQDKTRFMTEDLHIAGERMSTNFYKNAVCSAFSNTIAHEYGDAFFMVNGYSYFYADFTSVAEFKARMSGVHIYYEKENPTVTTLMTGLTEQEVATLIELYGSVEIVGNTQKQYAKPNLKTIIQCEKAVES